MYEHWYTCVWSQRTALVSLLFETGSLAGLGFRMGRAKLAGQ